MSASQFHGYNIITTADEPYIPNVYIRDLVRDFCTNGGLIVPAEYTGDHRQPTFQAEAEGIAEQDISAASTGFERNRLKVLDALRAIIRSVFEEYDLAVRKGLDIGSGATGAMVHEFIPPSHKEGWTEVEINPGSVTENRRRHPGANVRRGSYYDLSAVTDHNSRAIVTGLSTLDNSHFLPNVMDSIAQVMKRDGMFLHVQDVRPGNGVTVRWANKNGLSLPRHVDIVPADNSIFGIYAPGREYYSASELLRRELGEVLAARKDMEVLLNHWVTARALPAKGQPGQMYYQNIALTGAPAILASAVVTLARKR